MQTYLYTQTVMNITLHFGSFITTTTVFTLLALRFVNSFIINKLQFTTTTTTISALSKQKTKSDSSSTTTCPILTPKCKRFQQKNTNLLAPTTTTTTV